MNEFDKKDLYNIYFGYYQELLTTKQKEIFNLYYEEDYSLSEIAESLKVSRNAVWDTLKKVIEKLEDYEAKLHLVKNDQLLKEKLLQLEKYTNEDGLKIINEIREME